MYPESTALITEMEATGVQLKPGTYIEWDIALNYVRHLLFVFSFKFFLHNSGSILWSVRMFATR